MWTLLHRVGAIKDLLLANRFEIIGLQRLKAASTEFEYSKRI